jgi:hypothetical protein
MLAPGVGTVELPLYRAAGEPFASMMDVSNRTAVVAGLTLTDPAKTAADTTEWLRGKPFVPNLSPEMEAKLIHDDSAAS